MPYRLHFKSNRGESGEFRRGGKFSPRHSPSAASKVLGLGSYLVTEVREIIWSGLIAALYQSYCALNSMMSRKDFRVGLYSEDHFFGRYYQLEVTCLHVKTMNLTDTGHVT